MKVSFDEWSRITDEFTAFMLGLDDPVERTIIRFLYDKHRWVGFKELKDFTMVQTLICFNQRTLSRRLDSLVDFKIIVRRTEHDNKTFYKLADTFISELSEKKEKFY